MFRSGCLESIEALMAEGEIYDIEYEPERKTGKWIKEQRDMKVMLYKCAVIDDTSYDVAKDYPFCHCGADMRSWT